MKSEVYNQDCMEYMKSIPDLFFDLAICDPPYGIGQGGRKNKSRGSHKAKAKDYPDFYGGDACSPPKEFFDEIFRVSKNQIFFGANHYIEKINRNSSCWIVWDKENFGTDFADCELAWTSYKKAVRKFKFRWCGCMQENERWREIRIHPTQKPIALYAWILDKFALSGDKIFDPMMGGQSSRIAASMKGFDYYGCELSNYYFEKGCERFDELILGIEKKNGLTIIQNKLF